METEVVGLVSFLGALLSVGMVFDAFTDVRLVKEKEPNDYRLLRVARVRLLNECARLAIQVFFFIVAVIYYVEGFNLLREYAIWLLVGVPIVIAAWSLFSMFDRRKWLRGRYDNGVTR